MTRTPLRSRNLCWCGCKTQVSNGSFFARGHDKLAEAALLAAKYDSAVAQSLADHGFGPDNSVVAAAVADGGWERCPVCGHPGNDTTMRNHQAVHAKSGRGADYPLMAMLEADEYSHHARYEGEWPQVSTRCGILAALTVVEPQRGLLCPACHDKASKEGD